MDRTIIKASGRREEFEIGKLVHSLMLAGAAEDIAWDIAKKVEKQITPTWRTKHIYRFAKRYLRQFSRAADMKYSIKRAMYAMGPAGFQFEQFFAGILKAYGYQTETNKFLNGRCVRHEVDVFAVKGGGGTVIECKYHSDSGNPTDVKVALYINSRVEDIKHAYNSNDGNPIKISEGWLVTNTRCTCDAIKYSECVGLKIVSWKYPEDSGLERMIEEKRLYPVTMLSSIRKGSLDILFRNNIVFARDIADLQETVFVQKSGLDPVTAAALKKEADALYFGS